MSKTNWKVVSTPSSAQTQANRAKAKSSTGPRTYEGKTASSKNATTHGLTGKRVVLDSEDAAAYAGFRTDLENCWLPVGEREHCAFDEYVTSLWRLQRCRRTEPAVLDDCIETLAKDNPELTPDQALARVFTDPIYQKKMSLFLRYQSSIERAVNRALKELTQLQENRRENELMVRLAPRANVAGHTFEPFQAATTPVHVGHSFLVTEPPETFGFVSQF
jgi:hypothetical protein